jgi:hypothetical protein
MSRHDMSSKPQNMSAKTFQPEQFIAEMLGAINQNDPRHIALTRPYDEPKRRGLHGHSMGQDP